MFTGIIEELGKVISLSKNTLEIKVKDTFLKDIKLGSSISVNGACLTVININPLKFEVSFETLEKTNLKFLKPGDFVNLEKALKINSRLDGHFVLGHVDTTIKILDIKKQGDFYIFKYDIPKNFEKYLVYKGSVAIDGISLTVASLTSQSFEVAVIPHTYKSTNLQYRKMGDICNFEADILGKYVVRNLELQNKFEKKALKTFLF